MCDFENKTLWFAASPTMKRWRQVFLKIEKFIKSIGLFMFSQESIVRKEWQH